MKGEIAILNLRSKLGPATWETLPISIRIRENKQNLWTEHGEMDVAAMYIGIPENASVMTIPMSMLADDNLLAKYEIHPGDQLDCLGYPLGFQSRMGGFPVLRSGKIASYPLLPTKQAKTFLLDLRVFPGNSGGPVYISYSGSRIFGGAINTGTAFGFIMGLLSGEVRVTEKIKELYGQREQEYPLGLAEIIHARFILETVELLPAPGP